MQRLPLHNNSPSLPNQIFNAVDTTSVFNINISEPIHQNKAIHPRLLSKRPTFNYSSNFLMKDNQIPEDKNRSLPHLTHLCFFPKTRKFSQMKRTNSRIHESILTKNLHTSSTPTFQTALLNLPLQALNKEVNITEPQEKFCKICFENTETKTSGNLINPCKCTGTVRYIHEECLKTWQVSQNKDIKNAQCELCHSNYSMDFKMGMRFYPRQAIEDGLLSFISSLCLFILIATLFSIIIIFAIQL